MFTVTLFPNLGAAKVAARAWVYENRRRARVLRRDGATDLYQWSERQQRVTHRRVPVWCKRGLQVSPEDAPCVVCDTGGNVREPLAIGGAA